MDSSFEAGLRRILNDRRSGSSTIAVKTCRLLCGVLRAPADAALRKRIVRSLDTIVTTFPAMALLQTLRERLIESLRQQRDRTPSVSSRNLRCVLRSFENEMAVSRQRAAAQFARHVGARNTFLTISASGSVLAAAQALAEARRGGGKPHRDAPSFVVCESQPAREGITMARRLDNAGCRVTLIRDAAIGQWIARVDAAVLGADWIDDAGFVNKTGSLAISRLAQHARKNVYVVGDTLRLRKDRPRPDALHPAGTFKRPAALPGAVKVDLADFERVPWSRVHIFVTEHGARRVFSPLSVGRGQG